MTTAKTESSEQAPEQDAIEVLTPEQQATKLTRRFVLWSMGGSLIPVPFADLAAVIGVQIKMLRDMAKIYEVPFAENRTKSILTTLIGSLGIAPGTTMLLGSLVKLIPGVGTFAGTISLPVVVGAITYATGKVFIMHFESGGTLLDFKPETMKEFYIKQFNEGKKVASELKDADAKAAKAPAK